MHELYELSGQPDNYLQQIISHYQMLLHQDFLFERYESNYLDVLANIRLVLFVRHFRVIFAHDVEYRSNYFKK